MILAQQFRSLWGNRPLLADLYALPLHALLLCQITTDFLSLDRNRNVKNGNSV